ncbi:hypothetical protein ACFQAS_08265 [Halopenitus salinus]|uniref:DUF8030 domain-containing protein n=1 Tax=Halopenitus salinus TaxID=1198295 RepID=A0ABD5UVM0_9EURY
MTVDSPIDDVESQYLPSQSEVAPPWAHLDVELPTDRSPTSIVALVECALVEMTHEPVGAEVISWHVWGVKRTQYIAVDGVGDTFTKRHFDERLGWSATTIKRETVRDELIAHITRASHRDRATTHHHDSSVGGLDRFRVAPVHVLWKSPTTD